MGQKVKVSGTYRAAIPYVNIGGTWKVPKSVYNKVSSKWYSSFLQGGINDSGFTDYDTANRANNDVGSSIGGPDIVVQSDGKILVGGYFTAWNGTAANYIVRLNSDGTIDTTFTTNAGTAANGGVFSIALQSDGKILVGGAFRTWNGTTVNYIVRLNSDGTRDTTFTTNTGTAANNSIYSIVVQSDGKILVGGGFVTWNGTTVNYIVRLNSDGTRDTTFTTNAGTAANSVIYTMAIQSDGKILVGGNFTTWGGVTVNRIVRLNSDGTRDTTFTTNTGTAASGQVFFITLQSDGKILVGGGFGTWNGTTVNCIVRLNSDGTRETAFTTNAGTGVGGAVNSLAVESGGKILVGGALNTWNGITANGIIRLNSDGTKDTVFTTNTGTATGASTGTYAIALQSDGKILLGGNFTTWNGTTVNRIVRINSDGTTPTSTNIDGYASIGSNGTVGATGGTNIVVQSDGKILVGGAFTTWGGVTVNRIVRINSDGTRDTTFTTNAGTAANNSIFSIALQSDGKIILGGTFTTWDGVTVNRIVRINSDGTRDTTFTTNTGTAASSTVYSIALQSDGKILLGGAFPTWNGTTVNYIVRLNSDGTRDTTFTTNTGTAANNAVYSIAVQSDGKILVGGAFTTWGGVTVNRIVRINSDGTRDTTFTTNTGTAASGAVYSIALQSDGKILVGGNFTTWGGVTVNYIVRLNSDGTRDTTFTTNTGTAANGIIYSIAVQSDGKILVGGAFTTWGGVTVNRIVRINSDGTRDTTFTTNTGTAANNSIFSIALQSDGKILVGGAFSGFNNINRSYIARIGGDIAV